MFLYFFRLILCFLNEGRFWFFTKLSITLLCIASHSTGTDPDILSPYEATPSGCNGGLYTINQIAKFTPAVIFSNIQIVPGIDVGTVGIGGLYYNGYYDKYILQSYGASTPNVKTSYDGNVVNEWLNSNYAPEKIGC